MISIRKVASLMLLSFFVGFPAGSFIFAETVSSPDSRVKVTVEIVDRGELTQVAYTISFKEKPLMDKSTVVFVRKDGTRIGDHLKLVSTHGPTTHQSTWRPVYGERSTVEDHYRELTLRMADEVADCPMTIVFRCYDSGVAFHAVLGDESSTEKLSLEAELTEFCFRGDHDAWCTTSAQGEYVKRPISMLGDNVERPLVVRTEANVYAAVAEAKLVDYARMKLQKSASSPHTIVSQLSSNVHSSAPLTTPWRVIMIAESPGQLLENNDIFLNLNEPCAIEDTSWIKPGKVLRDITLSTEGGKACIDFAAEHGLQYVEFDAGWYGHEYDDASDATTITVDPKRSPGPLDLQYLIEYANERDIGIILYVNRRALERQLDDILPLYKSWGVSGVKYGFVNVGSQEWTSWLHLAIRKAAEHELMVDVHDEYRPTGYSRTYPNLMTQEGVRGDEAAPPTEQTLTSLFTRTLAGASDFKICYFNERVDQRWSHAHQLAKAMCFYDPWQFLFWYDTPMPGREETNQRNLIKETPELEFFRQMPTVWDDTKVLHGEIGEYAVIARRWGDRWFVGALNNSEPRTLQTPLSFLDASQQYTATIYKDDPSVNTRTRVGIDRVEVDSSTTLAIELLRNGGQAMIIAPSSQSQEPSSVPKGQ